MPLNATELAARVNLARAAIKDIIASEADAPENAERVLMNFADLLFSMIETIHEINDKLTVMQK